jgi:hypothetical protein
MESRGDWFGKNDKAEVECVLWPPRGRSSHTMRRSLNLNQLVAPSQIEGCLFVIEHVRRGEKEQIRIHTKQDARPDQFRFIAVVGTVKRTNGTLDAVLHDPQILP